LEGWDRAVTNGLVWPGIGYGGRALVNEVLNFRVPQNGGKLEMGYVRFEVFTAVTMKNGVFWDV
jgi:hypothetical protein